MVSSNKKIEELKAEISKTKATNRSPLYNTMLYWSQKPYTITRAVIDTMSKPGDIVMDPFMGSGVTLIECLRKSNERMGIGVDVNEMPIFLCTRSLYGLSSEQNKKLFELLDRIDLYNKFYYTECGHCGNAEAIITKVLYDREPEQFSEIQYKCSCRKGILKKKPSESDIENFHHHYRACENIENIKLLENSRIAVKANETISDKFSERNFHVLDIIRGEIDKESDEHLRDIELYIYASILHKSKILDVKMSSQWPLWIPKKNCVERNVVEVFKESIVKYVDSRKYVDLEYNASNVQCADYEEMKQNERGLIIFDDGIQNVTAQKVPNDSVDLVVTDPPYLGQVPYSEYMQIYKAFLGKDINFSDEIVMTNAKQRNIEYDEYMRMMGEAFANISRMMKEGSYMFMYFHDPSLVFWRDLVEIFTKAKLEFTTTIHVDKTIKTLKKILDPKKTMSGETFIVFKKNNGIANANEKVLFNDNHKNRLRRIATKIIEANPKHSVTTSMLYDNGILEYLIANNIIGDFSDKYSDLADFFGEILKWNPNTGEWEEA